MINPEVNEETLEISFPCASSYPCERYDWFDDVEYVERLVISPEAVEMTRLNTGASVLKNHDTDKIIGKVVRAWIEEGALCVRIQFRTDNMSRDLFKDIASGIVPNVSIGYAVQHYNQFADENGKIIREVDKWLALEVSVAVGIPADPTVGFYRSYEYTIARNNNKPRKEENKMKRADENPKETEMTPEEMKKRISELEAENDSLKEAAKETETKECGGDGTDLERSLRKIGDDIVKSIQAPHISTRKDDGFDIADAFRYMMTGEGAEHEREISDSIYQSLGQKRGGERSIMIPFSRDFGYSRDTMRGIFKRELADVAGSGSGLVAQQNFPDLFVDYVRNKIGVKNATFLTGLSGAPVTIPAMTTDTSVAWISGGTTHTDANADVGETTPVIGALEMNPHKLGGYTVVGKDLLLSGTPDAVGIVMRSLMTNVSHLLGTTILKGNASNPAITGLATASGVQTNVIATIASATWANMLGFAAKVEGLQTDGELEFVMSAADKATFKSIAKGQYGSGFLCEDDRIDGHLVHVDGSLSTGEIFFGDFSNVIVGQWGGIELMLDPYRHARSGMVEVIVQLVCDIVVRRPNTFVKRTAS